MRGILVTFLRGYLVIGLYHKYGRTMTRVKQKLASLLGEKIIFFDINFFSIQFAKTIVKIIKESNSIIEFLQHYLCVNIIKNDDSVYLVESVKKLTNKIHQLKSTYAWKWGNTPDQEREIVKGMILQSLGLAVSVDDIMKEK